MTKALILVVCLSHEDVGVEIVSFLILVLLGANVVTKFLVWNLLVGLEEEGQEVLSDLSSCRQGVNKVFDIGIEFPNVIADGGNVGVQRAKLFSDMEDRGVGVNMALMDDDLEEGCPTWDVVDDVLIPPDP